MKWTKKDLNKYLRGIEILRRYELCKNSRSKYSVVKNKYGKKFQYIIYCNNKEELEQYISRYILEKDKPYNCKINENVDCFAYIYNQEDTVLEVYKINKK